uniref:30S ribosomal protein S21 n=1 Tax=Thalassionema nitzschioides TaxID=33649 RepID=A0A6T5Y9J2_9STRA|mmetsp:Transcript_24683/g.36557  ORF Transcript_24683/g.36557 Transcript_24683/m.36557 type:complete len:111 (+) Transcript_24683:128-460(+)|eukprot:CAMPEP_0194201038 /NCGR_PEP_ID=MMETSP0156-20130528/1423_1 /TAXON_ID=33649 /ORGANISM="Thalassionema nitzschioides, Strain L26-B" /LENGTH=110 /DNA_ID=CAMNT_0038926137 /DNA_START=86 /DNA_END=418 /DNA_ORIENTATION=-
MGKFNLFATFLLVALALVSTSAFAPQPVLKSSASSMTELDVSIKVSVGDGEPIESALRRFKREVNKSRHLIELRHKRHFENKQDRIKRKIKERGMRRKFERMNKKRMQRF